MTSVNLVAAAASAVVLAGCVAQIRETRLDGAERPAPDAVASTITERRAGADGATECRDLAVTAPMMREVVIRRTFADDAQERDAAMAMLLGGAIGLVAYGQDKVVCPETGGGCSVPTKAAYALLGLAAIPIAFLAYNAIAVRDTRVVELAAPEARPGPWRTCAE